MAKPVVLVVSVSVHEKPVRVRTTIDKIARNLEVSFFKFIVL